MVAWTGLRSTPPQAEPRKGAWFWQDGGNRNDDDLDVGYSVVNRCEEQLLCMAVLVVPAALVLGSLGLALRNLCFPRVYNIAGEGPAPPSLCDSGWVV